jgi:hypothetical protein
VVPAREVEQRVHAGVRDQVDRSAVAAVAAVGAAFGTSFRAKADTPVTAPPRTWTRTSTKSRRCRYCEA